MNWSLWYPHLSLSPVWGFMWQYWSLARRSIKSFTSQSACLFWMQIPVSPFSICSNTKIGILRNSVQFLTIILKSCIAKLTVQNPSSAPLDFEVSMLIKVSLSCLIPFRSPTPWGRVEVSVHHWFSLPAYLWWHLSRALDLPSWISKATSPSYFCYGKQGSWYQDLYDSSVGWSPTWEGEICASGCCLPTRRLFLSCQSAEGPLLALEIRPCNKWASCLGHYW